jgi:transposase
MPYLYETEMGRTLAERHYREGLSINDLALMYDVPVSAARKCVTAYRSLYAEDDDDKYRYRFSKAQRKEIADRYMTGGVSLEAMSRELKCSETTIHNAVVEHYGPDFKKKLPGSPVTNGERVMSHIQNGVKSMETLAVLTGLAEDTIAGIMYRHGYAVSKCKCCGSFIELRRLQYCSDHCAN